MNAKLIAACLVCVLAAPVTARSVQMHDDGLTPPKAARELVARATDLAGRDRIDEATDAARRATVIAPALLDAHVTYIALRANFQGEIDAVTAEYEDLMRREPNNPVYPLALYLSDVGRGPGEMRLLRLVATLSPGSSWGHFAQSFVIAGKTWETMNEDFGGKGREIAQEALAAIDANAGKQFYLRAIRLQEAVYGVDAALITAQRMASRGDLRPDGLRETWRLRLVKARGSQQVRDDIKADLKALSRSATDIPVLAAVRDAYMTLVRDSAAAESVEQQILRIDPAWYPERGRATVTTVTNLTGLPYAIHAVNRQFAIYADVERLVLAREADWRKEIASFEALLQRHPTPALERFILGFMFRSARRAGDVAAMTASAERIALLDPADTAPFAMTALAMAATATDLPAALDLAMKAERGVMEFRAVSRPPSIPAGDFASRFSVEQQQANYRTQRALALHSTGAVLLANGRAAEAEERLRQSVALNRSGATLAHLAEALDKLGRSDEAQALTREGNERVAADVQKRLTNRPASDFELEATGGRRYRLSELKGKVVLLNFWATWCGPCVGEMPLLSATYEKYKARGVEILAISTDEASDRGRVRQFAEGQRLRFPVLYDEGVAKAFGVNGYPTTVFIDRQGNIRYEESGAFDSSGQRLEIILAELLR